MDLCQYEEWKLFWAFEYSWKINFEDKNTLISTFTSHNGNYVWCLSLKPVLDGIYCTRCSTLINLQSCRHCGYNRNNHNCSVIPLTPAVSYQIYYLEVKLQNFAGKYPNTLETKKISIQILNENNKDFADERIKKEVWIDKVNTIFSINFGFLEAEKMFLNNFGLNVVVRIFDISKKTNAFEKLLKSGECSDFKIIINEKEFLVHKCLLAAKSDYFSAMFKHETKEQIEGVMTVPDMSVEVMNALLRFIYCDDVDIKVELLYELLTAADVYQIKNLKTVCEEKIFRNLTVGNLEECIVYADTYNNDFLKQVTIKFITEKKKCGDKFSEDEINNLKSTLTSISSSYLSSLVCKLLI